jgi:flagellar biosynthesis/type III secretory pathway protein FliH
MSSTPKRNDASWMRALDAQPVRTPAWVPATQGEVRRAFTTPEHAPPQPAVDPLAGERVALAERARELDAAIAEYKASAASLNDARRNLVASSINDLTALAFQVGKELALQTLTTSPEAVATLITRLANEMGTDSRVTVRVASEDFTTISQAIEQNDTMVVTADATLKPGACVITAKGARLETSFAQRENAVKRALGIATQEVLQ